MNIGRHLIHLRRFASIRPHCSVLEGTSVPSFDTLIDKYNAAYEGSDQHSDTSVDWQEQKAWLSAPVVYCDGAFDWNKRRAGIGIFWGPSDGRNLHLALTGDKITNIRAELQAVNIAILQAWSLDLHRVCIRTDCAFVVKVVNLWIGKWSRNGWRKSTGSVIENVDDIKTLNDRLQLLKVRIEHVYGHQKCERGVVSAEEWEDMTGDERDAFGNSESDRLAQMGIDGPSMTDADFESSCQPHQ